MNYKGLVLLCLFGICSCVPSVYEKFHIPNVKDITSQSDHCIGYHSFSHYNEFKECVYEEIRCLDDQRGSYCAYSKCPDSVLKDTLRYLEFKANPEYVYRKNVLCSEMKKVDYLYVADGKCFLKEWHSKRCHVTPIMSIYVEVEAKFDELHFYNSIVGVCGWGDQVYWSYGRQEGEYKNGRRVGQWIFSAFSDPFFTQVKEELKPLFCRQFSNYKDGLKHGNTVYLFTSDSSQVEPQQWSDTLMLVPYQDGNINGWVKELDKKGNLSDAAFYKNGLPDK